MAIPIYKSIQYVTDELEPILIYSSTLPYAIIYISM